MSAFYAFLIAAACLIGVLALFYGISFLMPDQNFADTLDRLNLRDGKGSWAISIAPAFIFLVLWGLMTLTLSSSEALKQETTRCATLSGTEMRGTMCVDSVKAVESDAHYNKAAMLLKEAKR